MTAEVGTINTPANGALPGLARNNSIDPSTLGRPARRMRAGKRQGVLNDSGLTAGSTGTDSASSFGSKWESVKFSANNFVTAKTGILEDFYDLGDLLGEGGFGEVYACTHLETGEERAVKIMEKSQSKPSVNEAIVQEYNILKDLDHPNILKVYEMYETKNYFFIVTDLYSGGDLFSELEDNGCLGEVEASTLMNAMLSCMNYCHKRNLVHLDLKPENVLIARADKPNFSDVKIIDFGLAQFQEDKNKKMTGLEGSSYYMSPQVVGRSYDGCKADVWSCGVMVHVLMTGYAPFDGPAYNDILKAITKGTFDFEDPEWDGVSDECLSFIRFCLTYDEEERPSAEQALQHPFLRKTRNRTSMCDIKSRLSARRSLKHLGQFCTRHSKLKQASCAIMASQLLSQEEKDQIDSVFRSLDAGCDGQLCKDDLRRSYKEFYDTEVPDKEVDAIFEQVNFSATGTISYSEFAIATMMAQGKVDEDKLWAAFNVFDEDDKGFISADDIKRVLQLGDEQDAYLKKKILRQVDADQTGKIDFEAFKKIMRSNSSLMRLRRKNSVKRSPRTRRMHASVDMKEVLGASLLDASLMDNSRHDQSDVMAPPPSPYGSHHQRRLPNPDIILQGLEELDEDNSSKREDEARRRNSESTLEEDM
ncbi:MAP kinase-activated protein kinase 2 (Fragment) [Seminavis robusta]|uniref:non-specific serine/threonine protein kinase n=1 Tax=Seminavis robusta TaxID=568900 RepID=A0A9N8H5C3_9STRA